MSNGSSTTVSGGIPPWLPPIVPFTGNWDVFIRTLYAVFEIDFKKRWPIFRGCPVWHDRRIDPADPHGFEEGFWHLVSRDDRVWNQQTRRKEKQRLPEIDRASHLPWARPTVDHEADPEVVVWDFDQDTNKGRVIRTYLWLKSYDYVLVLERQQRIKGDVFILVTVFLVDIPAKRKDLESRFTRRK